MFRGDGSSHKSLEHFIVERPATVAVAVVAVVAVAVVAVVVGLDLFSWGA